MKISHNWLNLFTDISKIEIHKLSDSYSNHTVKVIGNKFFLNEDKIVVGKIIEAHKHTNSDHLNIVQVNLGALGNTQIVCGASNVLQSKYVPVATVGTIIKGEFEIKSTRLRGEDSNGMICSEDELELQQDRASGIMKLEDYFDIDILENQIGKPFGDLEIDILGNNSNSFRIKMKDIVLETDDNKLLNRPDLFSIEGNAREFGDIFGLKFQPYSKSYAFTYNNLNTKIETNKVLAYHLIKVEGVNVGVSPFGISYMLNKSGINPKFDLVDMTNYIMTELGQPMHAFDADKIKGKIIVRMAKNGEKMLALNGETYELNETDIIIADEEKVLAIGGIMGGLDSSISETTSNIYIESACFDAECIKLTSNRLGLQSDSSVRYEKSQDPLLTYRALSRALDFLSFIGKTGKIVGDSEYIDNTQVN